MKIDENDNLAGSFIEKYQIKGLIKKGGMAAAYLAYDPSIQKDVVLKVLEESVTLTQDDIERFKREATAQGNLSEHDNILQVYTAGESVVDVKNTGEKKKLHYIVMEKAEKTLDDIINEEEITPTRAVEITKNIASALEYAHSKGKKHRDIKPGNIMFVRKAERLVPKISDFGLVKEQGKIELTKSGQKLGTVKYFPPELITKREYDEKSEVYALGLCLYEMLTASLPYRTCQDDVEVQRCIVNDLQKLPRTINRKIPSKVQNIIMKAIEKNPDKRYSSMTAFMQDLENLGTGKINAPSVLKKQAQAIYYRFKPWILTGTSLAMLGAGILGYNQMKAETVPSLQSGIQKTPITDEMLKPTADGTENAKLTKLKGLYDSLETKLLIERIAPMIEKKIIKEGEYPIITDKNGEWIKGRGDGSDDGFWPSILWIGYNHFSEKANNLNLKLKERKKFSELAEKFKNWAVKWTLPLEYRKTENTQTNIADIFQPFVQAYEATGEKRFRDAALTAAETICKRYNPKAKFIRDLGELSKIDTTTSAFSFPHLDLLWDEYKQTGERAFYDIALNHAETLSKELVDERGSAYSRITLNLEKESPLVKSTFSKERKLKSDMAVSQMIYGLDKAYQVTGKKEFLDNANKVLNYYKRKVLAAKEINGINLSMVTLALSENNSKNKTDLMNFLKILTSKKYLSGKNIISNCQDPPRLENGDYIDADYRFIKAIDNLNKDQFSEKIFNANKCQTAPKIDGNLDDLVWQETIPQTILLEEKTGFLSENPTLAYIRYDDKNLYFAFKCFNPLASKTTERDSKMWKLVPNGEQWEDDAVEIAIDDKKDKNPYFNFIINSLNTQYDAIARNKDWNGKWQSKTKIFPDYWTSEIAIPLKEIGNANEFDLNIIRQRCPEKISWSYTPKALVKRALDISEIPDYKFGKLLLK